MIACILSVALAVVSSPNVGRVMTLPQWVGNTASQSDLASINTNSALTKNSGRAAYSALDGYLERQMVWGEHRLATSNQTWSIKLIDTPDFGSYYGDHRLRSISGESLELDAAALLTMGSFNPGSYIDCLLPSAVPPPNQDWVSCDTNFFVNLERNDQLSGVYASTHDFLSDSGDVYTAMNDVIDDINQSAGTSFNHITSYNRSKQHGLNFFYSSFRDFELQNWGYTKNHDYAQSGDAVMATGFNGGVHKLPLAGGKLTKSPYANPYRIVSYLYNVTTNRELNKAYNVTATYNQNYGTWDISDVPSSLDMGDFRNSQSISQGPVTNDYFYAYANGPAGGYQQSWLINVPFEWSGIRVQPAQSMEAPVYYYLYSDGISYNCFDPVSYEFTLGNCVLVNADGDPISPSGALSPGRRYYGNVTFSGSATSTSRLELRVFGTKTAMYAWPYEYMMPSNYIENIAINGESYYTEIASLRALEMSKWRSSADDPWHISETTNDNIKIKTAHGLPVNTFFINQLSEDKSYVSQVYQQWKNSIDISITDSTLRNFYSAFYSSLAQEGFRLDPSTITWYDNFFMLRVSNDGFPQRKMTAGGDWQELTPTDGPFKAAAAFLGENDAAEKARRDYVIKSYIEKVISVYPLFYMFEKFRWGNYYYSAPQ